MGLPTISRNYGIRDDYTDAILSTLNSASVTTDTFTSDGDILTWNVTMTNPSAGDFAVLFRAVAGPDPSKYPASIVRYFVANSPANSTGFQLRPWIAYTPSGTTDTGQTGLPGAGQTAVNWNTPGYNAVNFPLTNGSSLSGNTINEIGFEILSLSNQTGVFSFQLWLDFIYIFERLLTFPSVTLPIQKRQTRNIVVLPILGRQGGIAQDLGALSPEYTVSGHLINTIAGQNGWTNTFNANQWWHVFDSLVLESGVIVSDGNETWQWFTTDEQQIGAKVLIRSFQVQQVPGRPLGSGTLGRHDYVLSMVQFDILGETNLNQGAI